MNSTKTIKETKLPEKSALFSKLHNSDIATDDYKHAQQVWSHFGCTTFGDYHDIVLLADVFENFWAYSAHYISSAALAFENDSECVKN